MDMYIILSTIWVLLLTPGTQTISVPSSTVAPYNGPTSPNLGNGDYDNTNTRAPEPSQEYKYNNNYPYPKQTLEPLFAPNSPNPLAENFLPSQQLFSQRPPLFQRFPFFQNPYAPHSQPSPINPEQTPYSSRQPSSPFTPNQLNPYDYNFPSSSSTPFNNIPSPSYPSRGHECGSHNSNYNYPASPFGADYQHKTPFRNAYSAPTPSQFHPQSSPYQQPHPFYPPAYDFNQYQRITNAYQRYQTSPYANYYPNNNY